MLHEADATVAENGKVSVYQKTAFDSTRRDTWRTERYQTVCGSNGSDLALPHDITVSSRIAFEITGRLIFCFE